MTLPCKRAVVTSAASGIGKAIVLSFARDGADVVVPDTNAEKSAAFGPRRKICLSHSL